MVRALGAVGTLPISRRPGGMTGRCQAERGPPAQSEPAAASASRSGPRSGEELTAGKTVPQTRRREERRETMSIASDSVLRLGASVRENCFSLAIAMISRCTPRCIRKRPSADPAVKLCRRCTRRGESRIWGTCGQGERAELHRGRRGRPIAGCAVNPYNIAKLVVPARPSDPRLTGAIRSHYGHSGLHHDQTLRRALRSKLPRPSGRCSDRLCSLRRANQHQRRGPWHRMETHAAKAQGVGRVVLERVRGRADS